MYYVYTYMLAKVVQYLTSCANKGGGSGVPDDVD